MKWTDVPPTKQGWYWFKSGEIYLQNDDAGEPLVGFVEFDDVANPEGVIWPAGSDTCYPFKDVYLWSDEPIPFPEGDGLPRGEHYVCGIKP